MNKVINFPKNNWTGELAAPEPDASGSRLAIETESLIAEARARMFRRVFGEVVELIELCEEMLSKHGIQFDAGLVGEVGCPPDCEGGASALNRDGK